jgi:hypothetical protein
VAEITALRLGILVLTLISWEHIEYESFLKGGYKPWIVKLPILFMAVPDNFLWHFIFLPKF